MHDYKSLCLAVMICATLININKDTHTDIQRGFDQLYIPIVHPAELKIKHNKRQIDTTYCILVAFWIAVHLAWRLSRRTTAAHTGILQCYITTRCNLQTA